MIQSYVVNLARNNPVETLLQFAIYGLFLLLPWYHNYSGELQPVDILIAATSVLLIVKNKFFSLQTFRDSKTYRILLFLMGFLVVRYIMAYFSHHDALYQVTANVYYAILLTFFIHLILYLYDSRTKQEFYQLILNCLLLTIIIPFSTLIVFGPNYGLDVLQQLDPNVCRPALTFYNANQLGFFALINLAIFYYITLFADTEQLNINKIQSLILININLVFLLLSVSRAASPAFILYFLSYPIIYKLSIIKRYPKTFWLSLALLCLACLGSIYIYHHIVLPKKPINQSPNIGFFADLYLRSFKGISHNFTSLKVFLLGNGSLFNPARLDHMEYHNNFTSLFNQAGIAVLLLYCYLIFDISVKLLRRGLLYVMPFVCYLIFSDLHYAFRTRMNWLFFAIIIFMLIYQNRSFKKKL